MSPSSLFARRATAVDEKPFVTFVASGWSMHPVVPDGSILMFRRGARATIGDIALVRRGETLVAHRVVGMSADSVTTWGDGLWMPDRPCSREDVVGRCVLMLRKGVPIDMDWFEIRVAGRVLAFLLPLLKRIPFLRP